MKTTGKKPIGFRFPYLLNPIFYNQKFYKILTDHGYLWTSNRQIRFVEELDNPKNYQNNLLLKLLHQSSLLHSLYYKKLIFKLLNIGLILNDHIVIKKKVSLVSNIDWLLKSRAPFYRENLLEIPILSTLDCFLFRILEPSIASPEKDLRQAMKIIKNEALLSNEYFNLNFHDWIIGTSNRSQFFDEILNLFTNKKNLCFITGTELLKIIKNYE